MIGGIRSPVDPRRGIRIPTKTRKGTRPGVSRPSLLVLLLIVVAGMASAAPLHGALAGVPEAPTPAPLPSAWLALHNDVFGDAVLNSDDFRTGGLTLGLRIERVVLVAEYSALTNRGGTGSPGSRTDELAYSLGYVLVDRESPHRPLSALVMAGVGARTYGELGGERVQNDVHGAFGYPRVRLPYDSEQLTSPIGYASGRLLWLPVRNLPRPLPPELGLELRSSYVISVDGHQQADAALELVTLGSQGAEWLGARYHATNGRGRTPTARIVDEHESGWSIVAGLGRQPGIYLSGGVDPQSLGIDGTIGFTVQPNNAPPSRRQLPVCEELLFLPDSAAMGVQLRLGTERERDARVSDGLRDELLVDYRFGKVAGYDWRGNRVDEDQLLIGYEPVLANHIPGIPWLACEEFVYGAGGVRVERVRVLQPGARFSQTTAASPVLQGGVGLRLGLDVAHDPTRWYNQARVGIGYDGWLPLMRHHVTSPVERAYFLEPGSGAQLSVGFAMLW